MFCYIFFTSLALLITSDFVKSSSVESSEDSRKPLKIDLKTLKNAAEVVKALKALNEDGKEPDLQENYGNQEDKGLQGIDLDYLGFSGERHDNIRELLELIQKNRAAKEDHDQTRSELMPRVYYISNPEALEVYKEKIKRDNENYHSATPDLDDSNEKNNEIRNLWELLKTMRREGDANKKVYPKMMHPRLLHLKLETHVPVFGPSIHKYIKDDKEISAKKEEEEIQGKREDKKELNLDFLQMFTDAKKEKKEKLTTSLDNLDTAKTSSYSFEVTEKENLNEALRTAGFKYHILDDNIDDQRDDKRDSSDKSEDNDKRVTEIDFKAKEARSIEANKEFDDKSLESYKPKKKKDKSKFEDSDNFMKKSVETYKSPKKKERIDNNESLDYKKKNRWNKPAKKTSRWDKLKEKINKYDNNKKDRIEEKFNFKPKPRKEERNYEMNRPKIKPETNRPVRNKMTNLRDDNGVKSPFKLFGRTPVPIVGKRGIYEDD